MERMKPMMDKQATPLDTIDERIVAELQHNGRLTMKALAEHVGLSSPAMIERVRRLEERGVLAGYRATISPEAVGRPLTALITVDVDRRHYDGFINRLHTEPAVVECHRITGERSFFVKVHVASTEELEYLVDELADVGARCSTSVVLSSPIQTSPIVPAEGMIKHHARPGRRRVTPQSPSSSVYGSTIRARRRRRQSMDVADDR